MNMKINNSNKLWFTSDSHWGHKNIIKYCNRPFNSVEEMDETLISNWNSVVNNDDLVLHLGDFSFKNGKSITEYRKQLNGDIILVRGNHDSSNLCLDDGFFDICDYLELEVNDVDAPRCKQLIVCSHYAFRVWNKSHHGSYHLYGHSHGTLPDDPHSLSFDVGVDCWDYKPLSYSQVKEVMKKKSFKPIDHHGK